MRYFISFCIVLTGFLSMVANHNAAFYKQRLNVRGIDNNLKLAYVDSLLAYTEGNDSLLALKTELSYETGNYAMAIESFEKLGDRIGMFDISRQCRLRIAFIRSLHHRNQSSMEISECQKLLKLEKPDSLIYFDAMVYAIIYDLIRQTSLPFREDYVKKVMDILESAEKSGLPKTYTDRIAATLHSMIMKKAILDKDYDTALKEADMIQELPITEIERISLESNMAFVYMLINQFDAAEKCYQKILASDNVGYNHGICLMNYTHLLNMQGRYDETLDLIRCNPKAAAALNKDIYYSHLLANKAIAESNVTGFQKAFETLLENKELEDSLFFNSKIQDGIMQFDYMEKSERLSEFEGSLKSQKTVSLIYILLLSFFLFVTVALVCVIIRKDKRISSLSVKLRNSENNRISNEQLMSQISENERGKAAVQLLRLAKIEEVLNSITEITASRSKEPDHKLKLISDTLSAVKRDGDVREIFEFQFEQAHATFFKKLYACHPDLSPGEARMCAYLIMNLSSKEIASLTGKTLRSVEATRYRIGKKLNLPPEKTLVAFLRDYI